MRKFTFILSSLLLPLTSHAAPNPVVHCKSARAELHFSTFLHGSITIGNYTILDGKRAELPREGLDTRGAVLFYNQGHVFMVDNIRSKAPEFKLLGHMFGDETFVIEEGECVAL